jgi:kumamolisin
VITAAVIAVAIPARIALAGGSSTPGAASVVNAGAGSPSGSWAKLLSLSTDKGPARTEPVSVLVDLDSSKRPTVLDAWAKAHSLRVSWYSGESFCVLTGTAQSIGGAFGVGVDNFVSRTGQHFYSAVTSPSIPAVLASEVSGIGKISDYGNTTDDEDVSVVNYVPNGSLTPAGLIQAYGGAPLAQQDQGQGQTVVFIEVSPFSQQDVNDFTQKFNLPSVQVQVVGGIAPGGASETDEADMDIQTVHEIAPQAHLVYWDVLGTPGISQTDIAVDIADSIAAATKQFPGAVYSISLGKCESDFASADFTAMDSAASAAEATGSTIYASSGDTGGADCEQFGADTLSSAQGVQLPAAAPDITGVGGTSLSVDTSGNYLGETTWSWPMMSQGSSGGVSTFAARPSWQTGPGVGGQGVPDMREVPDVAADADPITGTAFVSDGSVEAGNGTSLAAPIWAGLTALMDQYLRNQGQSPIGFANPIYYRLAADSSLSPSPFHDVTIGGNVFFRAGPGYDPVTGLGSPDVAALTEDILNIDKGIS